MSILAAAALIRIDNKRGKQSDEVLLDAAPMRFALCYAIVQELDRYFKNRIPKHISQFVEYWPNLRQSLGSFLNPLYLRSGDVAIRPGILVTNISDPDLDPEITADMRAHGFLEPGYSKYHSLFPQIDLLRMSHPWFRLDPPTLNIINGFNILPVKITLARFREKRGLPAVFNVLKQLAAYLYTAIPEIASTERHKPDDLSKLGEQYLLRFADLVQQLPSYSAESRPLAPKERATKKLVVVGICFFGLFSHENLLVKFLFLGSQLIIMV